MYNKFQSFSFVKSFLLDAVIPVNGISETGHIITFDETFSNIILPTNAGIASYACIHRVDFTSFTEALLTDVNRPPRIIRANQTASTIDSLPAYSIFIERWDNSFPLEVDDIVIFEGATVNPPWDSVYACGMTCAEINSTLIEYENCFRQLHRDIARLGLPLVDACAASTDNLDIIQRFDFNEWGKIVKADSVSPWTNTIAKTIGEEAGTKIPVITYNSRGLIECGSEYTIPWESPIAGTYGNETTGKIPVISVNSRGLVSAVSEFTGGNVPTSSTVISGGTSSTYSQSTIFSNDNPKGKVYRIRIINLRPSVDGSALNLRFYKNNGADIINGSVYYYELRNSSYKAEEEYTGFNTTRLPLTERIITGYTGTKPDIEPVYGELEANGYFTSEITVFDPFNTNSQKHIHFKSTYCVNASSLRFHKYEGFGVLEESSALSGYSIYLSSGVIRNAQISVIRDF